MKKTFRESVFEQDVALAKSRLENVSLRDDWVPETTPQPSQVEESPVVDEKRLSVRLSYPSQITGMDHVLHISMESARRFQKQLNDLLGTPTQDKGEEGL